MDIEEDKKLFSVVHSPQNEAEDWSLGQNQLRGHSQKSMEVTTILNASVEYEHVPLLQALPRHPPSYIFHLHSSSYIIRREGLHFFVVRTQTIPLFPQRNETIRPPVQITFKSTDSLWFLLIPSRFLFGDFAWQKLFNFMTSRNGHFHSTLKRQNSCYL